MIQFLSHFSEIGWERGLNLLFPPRCTGCGQPGAHWCSDCDQSLVRLMPPICPQCGRPLDREKVCRGCLNHPLPLKVRSVALYRGPLIPAILHLKYRPNRQLARIMGNWLVEICRSQCLAAEGIVAVPLAPSRQQQRGYNQTHIIAKEMASHIGMPFLEQALIRVRETRSQVGLNSSERWRNVQGAFQAEDALVDGRNLFLVDDLFTTGATLAACAEALFQAGAAGVTGLTIGRA